MQSRCIIDDDVVAGSGNGAKFILVHSDGCCTLVSKSFPAYRFARSISNITSLNPTGTAATTLTFSRGLVSTLRWKCVPVALMRNPS